MHESLVGGRFCAGLVWSVGFEDTHVYPIPNPDRQTQPTQMALIMEESFIRDTYKKAYAKRPKEIIRQVDQLLLELDRDTRLKGREVIRFNCMDGVASFSLMTATLVIA